MNFYLRQTLPSDCAFIADLAIAEGWPGRTKQEAMSEAVLAEIISMPEHFSYTLCQENEQLVGFGQIWLDAVGRVNLVRILVAPTMRGRGVGKILCRLLLEQAKRIAQNSAQSSAPRLRVRRDNHAAIAVYQALGFHVVDEDSNQTTLAMIATY